MCSCYLRKQIPLSPHIPPSSSFTWALTAEHGVIQSWICLWSVWSVVPAVSPPQDYLLAGQQEKQRRPSCCVSTLQQHLKYPCVINTDLVTDPEHSNVWATMKKTNSVPACPVIVSCLLPCLWNLCLRLYITLISCFEVWYSTSNNLHLVLLATMNAV